MIRGVVVHLLNEQPVLVDLVEAPTPADTGILCTNIRMLDGRKPIFVDRADSTFFFPYLNVRFIEIPGDQPGEGSLTPPAEEPAAEAPAADEGGLAIDEDFLRRVREA